jgi:RNA polymerase sigma factor (sigma-70 family)
MNVSPRRLASRLADPTLAASLSHFVRARVPSTAVEDIVQSTLTEALDAERHPELDEDIVRWVHGICRHKVMDWFRRARREVPHDLEAGDDAAAAESAPQDALDLLRWAQKELPEGEENARTLEWMLREGEGEKLETIAAEANVPAPRVRQRVSRLRRYYKARWAAQVAALAALLLIALALALALRQKEEQVAPAPGPSLVPSLVPPAPPSATESLPPESPALDTMPETPSPVASSMGPSSPVPSTTPPSGSAAKPDKKPPRAASTTSLPSGKPAPNNLPDGHVPSSSRDR